MSVRIISNRCVRCEYQVFFNCNIKDDISNEYTYCMRDTYYKREIKKKDIDNFSDTLLFNYLYKERIFPLPSCPTLLFLGIKVLNLSQMYFSAECSIVLFIDSV